MARGSIETGLFGARPNILFAILSDKTLSANALIIGSISFAFSPMLARTIDAAGMYIVLTIVSGKSGRACAIVVYSIIGAFATILARISYGTRPLIFLA